MILRLILIAVVITLALRAARLVLRGIVEAAGPAPPARSPSRQGVKLVRDPVCGTHLPPANAISLTADGTTHYFCSEECRRKFRKSA